MSQACCSRVANRDEKNLQFGRRLVRREQGSFDKLLWRVCTATAHRDDRRHRRCTRSQIFPRQFQRNEGWIEGRGYGREETTKRRVLVVLEVALAILMIALRVALGAPARTVLTLVLAEAVGVAIAGLTLGAVATVATATVMRSMFFNVAATDPVTFAAVGSLTLVVAIFAAWLPLRRAMSIDPMTAMRAE